MSQAVTTRKSILDEPFFKFFRPLEGWRIVDVKPNSCRILDEKGRFRINVVVFQDKVSPAFLQRYSWDYGGENDGVLFGYVIDRAQNEKVIFQTESIALSSDLFDPSCSEAFGKVDNCIDEWFRENKPDYKDPMAYWDDDESSATN